MRHLIVLICLAGAAHGAELVWDGSAGDAAWGTAANWTPEAVPANNDTLVFPDRAAAAPILNVTNNLTLSGISLRVGAIRYQLAGNTLGVVSVVATGPGIESPTLVSMPLVTQTMLEIRVDAAAARIGFLASIMGPGGLRKTGAGGAGLGASNGYAGATTVEAGILFLVSSGSLGSTASGTTVSAGASLLLLRDVTSAEPLTLAGSGVAPYGALAAENAEASAVLATCSGPITLQGEVRVTARIPPATLLPTPDPGQELRLSGPIGGDGSLIVETSQPWARVELSGSAANTYTGRTELVRGHLRLTKLAGTDAVPNDLVIGVDAPPAAETLALVDLLASDQIADDATVTLRLAGTLLLLSSDGVASLAGTGAVRLNNQQLMVGMGDASSVFNGDMANSLTPAAPPGTGSLRKVGGGTFHWASATPGVSEFGGGITVDGGVMRIDATLDADTYVFVNAATVTGTGTVGSLLLAGGTVEPGTVGGIGTLTCAGLSLGATARMAIDFGASGADLIQVDGAVAIAGSLLTRITGGLASTRVIIANDGSDVVIGAGFSNWSPPAVAYNGGTGNDVAITPTVSVAFATSEITLVESATPVTVSVSIATAPATPVTVRWSMVPGTAVAGDYASASGTLTFPAGSAAPQTFAISAIDDATPETTESFTLLLTDPSSGVAIAAPGSATVTIPFNDGGAPPPPPPASGGGGGGGGGCGSGGGLAAAAAVGLLMAVRFAGRRRGA
ncbi:MAG TPA: Calx-beta domain-containing protein [Planctomycetota bacterium]|nr:Calx-beta domain-containing protein [Planctomycetota bacterium]